MIAIEDMPNWLRNWTPSQPNAVRDFFASRVVYYPGSGTDGQPVQFFGSRHAAHCFVFADYGIPMAHLLQELGEGGHPFAGYNSLGRIELAERDLTPNGWTPHVNPRDMQQAPRAPIFGVSQPYAFIQVLERHNDFDDVHGPKRLAILFLCADGIAAYDALFCQQRSMPPFAVVLQDHGFGGNWTRFGRDGVLEGLASTTGSLPGFLLVATNTETWLGYSAIDGTVVGGGGMHGFNRQLWQRTPLQAHTIPLPKHPN